jgi:predicted small secreted protein
MPTAGLRRLFYDGSCRSSRALKLLLERLTTKHDARTRFLSRISTSRGIHMTRLIALLLIAGTAALAGCNTVSGAGQDLSKGGQAISNSAEEHK